MSTLRASMTDVTDGGQWQVFVYPDNVEHNAVTADDHNVSIFRGAATKVQSLSTTDPFGPAEATLVFPKVTIFDRRGQGDLWWCVPEANVDICWVVGDQIVYAWEGFLSSFSYNEEEASSSMTVSCVGALRQLDHYLTKPEYLYAPITFERAILRQFENRPDLRVAPAHIIWPSWWDRSYALNNDLIGRPWLIPQEVALAQFWSGMVTRYTGQFEQVLTGYIQQLLSSMHTERGQFTLMLDRGRVAVLRHRDIKGAPDAETLVVDLLWPGVSLSVTEDHTQKLNAVYVRGRTLSGVTFSGMQVSNDGKRTYYTPYAARRSVHPETNNTWLDTHQMRREIQLEAADGMSADDAYSLARSHLRRFSDPGLTGSLSLQIDPLQNGLVYPRQAITAGMSIQVKSIFGQPDGRLFHIAESSIGEDGTTSLTIDTKYRDQLTVQEVRLRGRDALTPTRMLTTGNWQPEVSDMLFPWSYEIGAGYIPWNSQYLFRGIGTHEQFPWQNWTTAHPPSDPEWADKYIKVGPRSTNADENWSTPFESGKEPYPILLSAAGSARMIQIAAYDASGAVLPVKFHFSIYTSNTVDATVGPVIPAEYADLIGYPAGQHHPFWPGAWETYDENGVLQNPLTPQAEATADIIVGWGNYYEQCGFWPGQSSDVGDAKTGLFVDEASFTWDLTQLAGGVNPQEEALVNTTDMSRAMVYCLVYCEDQGNQDVYFLGRIYRAEPGTS